MKRRRYVVVLSLFVLLTACIHTGTDYEHDQLLDAAEGASPDTACSAVVDIDGPDEAARIVDGACRRFAETSDIPIQWTRDVMDDARIRIHDGAESLPCGSGKGGCARLRDERTYFYVHRRGWRRYLPNLIYRVLLADLEPHIREEEYNAELRDRGLCRNGGCGGFHSPCVGRNGGFYRCDSVFLR